MSFRKNLVVFGATSAALLAMSTANAAELVNLATADQAVVQSLLSAAHGGKMADQSTLVELKSGKDIRGNVHVRYAQEFNGVPVYGHQVIKHQRVTGAAKAPTFTGDYVNGLAADVEGAKAAFTSEQALAKAKQMYLDAHPAMKAAELVYGKQESKLVYFIDANQKAQLAYYVNFFVDVEQGGTPARPYIIMDAQTGAVLSQWNGLTTDKVGTGPGGNTKIGQYNYDGTNHPKLDVVEAKSPHTCTMSTTNVITVNLNGGTSGTTPYGFPCYVSNNDSINGGFSPANDAHYFGGQIYGMYESWYQIAPINSVLYMRVHYSTKYENAFWDGTYMSFGDGANMFYPLVCLDVAGHEVSHGFTEQNSGLEYTNQSGGLNESFSDMAGKSVEFYSWGTNGWTIGEQIFKQSGALRYMDQPSKDGRSIDSAKDYKDGLDPHYASGVFNRAFYLLATSNGYNTHKAFDLMVNANAHYWQPTSTYQDAAQGVMMAANDLGYDTTAVIAAFAKVGVTVS